MTFFLIAMSALFGGLRVMGVKAVLFQAFAHVWVGGLFGAGFKGDKHCMALAITLTVLETVCFLAGLL